MLLILFLNIKGGGGYITGSAAAAAAAAVGACLFAYSQCILAVSVCSNPNVQFCVEVSAYSSVLHCLMCQGAYVPDAAPSTTPQVTVAPAPAPATTTAPVTPAAAELPAAPAPAPTPAPAPVGVASYAQPTPTKRKFDESDELPANKRTKAAAETDEEQDSQSLTTKWMDSTVVKIRAELKKEGLDQTGRKAELVERLVAHLLL